MCRDVICLFNFSAGMERRGRKYGRSVCENKHGVNYRGQTDALEWLHVKRDDIFVQGETGT